MRYLYLLLLPALCCSIPQQEPDHQPPNILLIVADDLGYTDLGCFGGEIQTPNIDNLARRGIQFTRFHTSPYCAPSRAMLLTGNDNHVAGIGVQGMRSEEWGYEGYLTDRVIALPQLLKEAGYHTYMAGKWHIGADKGQGPSHKGFERSFSIAAGGANHFSSRGIFAGLPVTKYLEDGVEAPWPEGAYSTDLYTDKLIAYIDSNHGDGKPFFAYAAYTSPHWPLQVKDKFRRKYEGLYDRGYVQLRKERLERSKARGLIPEDTSLPPLHPEVTPWDSLSPKQQQYEARKMEIYAGMVDNLDLNVGRILQYLESIDELDNTLIVFMSDNGAAPEEFYHHKVFGPYLQQNYSVAFEDMGRENSFIAYGPPWAEACAAPFRYFKTYPTQGGLRSPLLIAGKGVLASGLNDEFITLLDLAPTFYKIAGISYPDTLAATYPLLGASMAGLLDGSAQTIHDENYVFAFEHINKAMIRKGDWKIVSYDLPFEKNNFALYHLAGDIGESIDLRDKYPGKYRELLRAWDEYVDQVHIQNPYPGDEDF